MAFTSAKFVVICAQCSRFYSLAINTFMLANNRQHLDIDNVLKSFDAAMPGDNVVVEHDSMMCRQC